MTRRRSKRYLSDADRQDFLAKVRGWRDACIAMQTRAPINDPFYRSISEVTTAIDAVAEAVTGSRDHFHTRMHSATPHLQGLPKPQAAEAGEPTSLEARGTVGSGRCGGE